ADQCGRRGLLEASMRRVSVKSVPFDRCFVVLRRAQGTAPLSRRSEPASERQAPEAPVYAIPMSLARCSQSVPCPQRFDADGPMLGASRSSERVGSSGPSIRVGDHCTEPPRRHARSLEAGLPSLRRFPAGEPACHYTATRTSLVVGAARAPDETCDVLTP